MYKRQVNKIWAKAVNEPQSSIFIGSQFGDLSPAGKGYQYTPSDPKKSNEKMSLKDTVTRLTTGTTLVEGPDLKVLDRNIPDAMDSLLTVVANTLQIPKSLLSSYATHAGIVAGEDIHKFYYLTCQPIADMICESLTQYHSFLEGTTKPEFFCKLDPREAQSDMYKSKVAPTQTHPCLLYTSPSPRD